jgi:crossover junction endodeoxyribonuclease RuvC
MTSTTYLGIDPGENGGLALLSDREVLWHAKIPETLLGIWKLIQGTHILEPRTTAVIEKVRSSPQMGVTSAFTFGRGYGQLEALLLASGISSSEVPPQTWQKALGIPKRRKDEPKPQFKTRLLREAQRRFPLLDVWNKTKGEQLAVCDALLIALYARQVGSTGESHA